MSYLRLEQITKRFGSFVANDNISLEVEAGKIHALLGENGAGKTTLMNILCGLYQPDKGQIFLQDQPVKIPSPSAAIKLGIGMIHQHFMLVPKLTVTENIILGNRLNFQLNLQREAEVIASLAATYHWQINPHSQVADLPIGEQQRVEILKALYRKNQLLILDEPTAVLPPQAVESLLEILRQLAASGHTIILISHKLEEVMSVCDKVTVLRRGQVVTTTTIQASSRQELARLMVGREVNVEREVIKSRTLVGERSVLEVNELKVNDNRQLPVIRNLSFQICSGEVLGVAGVEGNGQRELADALTGLLAVKAGKIQLSGKDITHWSVGQRVKQLKIAYIPEDRQKIGLILAFTVAKNYILKTFKNLPFCRHWFLQEEVIHQKTNEILQKFDIRADNSRVRVSQLSGGNQQKIVLARELSGSPSLIIAMQPTRGLDVGAAEYIQQCLLAERERGAAILYISTDLEEIMAISDRIAVIYEGEFVEILEAETATREQLSLLMASGNSKLTHLSETVYRRET